MSYGIAAARQFFQDLKANLPANKNILDELTDAIIFLSQKSYPLQAIRQQAQAQHLTSAEGQAAVKAKEADLIAAAPIDPNAP